MEDTYFEILPVEIKYLIFSKVSYDGFDNLHELIPMNMRKLFSCRYPDLYKNVFKIYNTYKELFEPQGDTIYEIIYKDLLYYGVVRKQLIYDINKLYQGFNQSSSNLYFKRDKNVNQITSTVFIIIELNKLGVYNRLHIYPQVKNLIKIIYNQFVPTMITASTQERSNEFIDYIIKGIVPKKIITIDFNSGTYPYMAIFIYTVLKEGCISQFSFVPFTPTEMIQKLEKRFKKFGGLDYFYKQIFDYLKDNL